MAITQMDKITINGILKKNYLTIRYYHFFPKNKKANYTKEELIEYLININITKLESHDVSYTSFNKVLYVISLLLPKMISENKTIKNEIIIAIKKLEEEYHKLVSDGVISENSDAENNLDIINTYIDKKTKRKINEQNREIIEENINLENKIKELENEIDKLLKEKEKQDKNLNSAIEKKKKELETIKNSKDKLNEQIKQLKQDKKDKDIIISTIKSEMSKLNKLIDSLNLELDKLRKEYELLNKKYEDNKRELEELRLENDKLKKELNYYEREQKRLLNNQNNLENIKHFIMRLLYRVDNINLIDIHRLLSNQGFNISIPDLFKIIMELKANYLINQTLKNTFSINRDVEKNKEITINKCNKDLDILFISDLQLHEISNSTLKDIDSILEYCINNNISYIVYLGNFIKLPYFNKNDDAYSILKYTEREVENISDKLPYVDGIRNIILGARREINGVNAGINPLTLLEKYRYDFKEIGFSHGILKINSSKVFIHTSKKFTNNNIMDELSNYYPKYSLDRKDSFIDIIGLGDKHYSDLGNSYVIVPSISDNGYFGDCTHVKFIIDEHSNIVNTMIMQLIKKNKLVIASQLQYRK